MRTELGDFWQRKYERPPPRGYGEFPVFSPWERDPLRTPEARRERTALLEHGGWQRKPLQEKYVLYRAATRLLMEP